RGRTRTARQGYRGRGRISGGAAPVRGGGNNGQKPDHAPASLPADAGRDRHREQFDNRVSPPDRSARAISQAGKRGRQAEVSGGHHAAVGRWRAVVAASALNSTAARSSAAGKCRARVEILAGGRGA